MSLKGFPHGQVWAACSCFHYVAPTKSKSSGNLAGAIPGASCPSRSETFSIRYYTSRETARSFFSPGPPSASTNCFRQSEQHNRPNADHQHHHR